MILWKIPCSIQSRLLGFVPVLNCLDAWGGYKFLVIYVGFTAVTCEKIIYHEPGFIPLLYWAGIRQNHPHYTPEN